LPVAAFAAVSAAAVALGFGGKVLRTTLSAEQTRKLEETLAVQGASVSG